MLGHFSGKVLFDKICCLWEIPGITGRVTYGCLQACTPGHGQPPRMWFLDTRTSPWLVLSISTRLPDRSSYFRSYNGYIVGIEESLFDTPPWGHRDHPSNECIGFHRGTTPAFSFSPTPLYRKQTVETVPEHARSYFQGSSVRDLTAGVPMPSNQPRTHSNAGRGIQSTIYVMLSICFATASAMFGELGKSPCLEPNVPCIKKMLQTKKAWVHRRAVNKSSNNRD